MGLFGRRRRWRSAKPQKDPGTPGARGYGRGLLQGLRLLVLILFAVLIVQLVRMQIFDSESYQRRAELNTLREVQVPSVRGLIYDREGRQLVHNDASYGAAILFDRIPEGEDLETYRTLEPLLAMTAPEIEAIVNAHVEMNGPSTPAFLKWSLDDDTTLLLREMEPLLPGLQVVFNPSRRYLNSELVSHVLGYVGEVSFDEFSELDSEGYAFRDRIGKTGIELAYEDLLRGAPGRKFIEVDAYGQEIKLISERSPVDGANLVLSIDLELQAKVAEILTEFEAESDNAAAVVMDIKSGEILSMVSLPTMDNNIFTGPVDAQELEALLNDPGKPLLNHAVSEMYQPGGTFKTIVGAAALEESVVATDTMITSRGYIAVEREFTPNVVDVFRDWATLGPLDFYGGLAMSSDVYYYYLSGGKADEGFAGLGDGRVAEYARAFGLGEITGIDLPAESAGLVPDATWKQETIGERWLLGDTYNFGIGQGYLAATPLQMLVAVAAIGNRGEMLVPRLLKEVEDSNGNVVNTIEPEVRQDVPISQINLDIISHAMMLSVTDGIASEAEVSELTVAGKTGTAEFGPPKPDGSYDTHGWFVGYAPFDDPQVAVVVFVQRGSGRSSAAPAASQILGYLFNGKGKTIVQELQEERQ